MSEISFPWPDTTEPGPQVGDGRKYTDAEWSRFWRLVFSKGRPDTMGVFPMEPGAVLGELDVTSPGPNQIEVSSGAAIVNGKAYLNDATVTLNVPSAGAGSTRHDRVVVRGKWDAGTGQYTTRLAISQGTAAGPPELIQTENATWEISLARYSVSEAGVISGLTQKGERVYCDFATGGNVPIGGIILWSGSAENIPARWALCDGQNGTPDLRDRFVVGAGGAYSPANTGGADTVNLAHTHTINAEASHTHSNPSTNSAGDHAHSQGNTGSESSHTHTQGATGSEAGHTHSNPSTASGGVHDHELFGFGTGITSTVQGQRIEVQLAPGNANWVLQGFGAAPAQPVQDHSHTLVGNTLSGGFHSHTQGATGSGSAHSHSNPTTNAGSAHYHTNPNTASAGAHTHTQGATGAGSSHTHTAASQLSASTENRPPYFALAYIMRLR